MIGVVVAAVGLLLWWPTLNQKVNEAGKWLFVLGVAFALWRATR